MSTRQRMERPMMPPFCVLCRVPYRRSGFDYEDFTLVDFRPVQTYPDDWAGHPEHCEWFCPSHLPLTEGLTHLPAAEALAHIRANLRDRDGTLPGNRTAGSAEEALDRAGGLRPEPHPPGGSGPIPVPAGLVLLVGPPASGKTSFVRALIAHGRIDEDAVVSSDEIRAELLEAPPAAAESDEADARIFEERDRRITARLAAGHTAVAESTNVTPQARARLIAIARRFGAPVTMLRFAPDLDVLLRQNAERGRTDTTAEDVRAYAAVMARHARPDQLRAEGADAVHDVPGRAQGATSAEAAAHFSFARRTEVSGLP
ncbi:AAA family ATPase [Streptomyces sp. NPDC087218]|uniref:AAA family ATPase n=1 Tax=Streptomyces sp. NPDC087218 TaxID=3365769 RepID=UPI00380BDFA8